ncbi:hypothetical protein F4780DRAFT_745061 [Xylariomycetidae sp. FL0641]|nr:hypothetical protein F4780DRAFT_745061 [Xylariomycetidae sp. FL0641]
MLCRLPNRGRLPCMRRCRFFFFFVTDLGADASPWRYCNYCHLICRTNSELRKHGKDQGHSPYGCRCGENFGCKSSLDRHIQAKSGINASRYPCGLCASGSRAFARRDKLAQHLVFFHKIVNPSQSLRDGGNDFEDGSSDASASVAPDMPSASTLTPIPGSSLALAPAPGPVSTQAPVTMPALMEPVAPQGLTAYNGTIPTAVSDFQGYGYETRQPALDPWSLPLQNVYGFSMFQPYPYPPPALQQGIGHGANQPYIHPQSTQQGVGDAANQPYSNVQSTLQDDGQDNTPQYGDMSQFQGFSG